MKKVYTKIQNIKGSLITLEADKAGLGDLVMIKRKDGCKFLSSVIAFDGNAVTLQVFGGTNGISTSDEVVFLHRPMEFTFDNSLLGRSFNSLGLPIDGGNPIQGDPLPINTPCFNPVCRAAPRQMVRTNIPLIDVFNCLVKSQKIPIFAAPGEEYNKLLLRICNQTDADVVVIGGMGLSFFDYRLFMDNAENHGAAGKTVMFVHRAVDPSVECILVPDMALACAERFAVDKGKNVLVLLSDMTAFADALKEISVTMDQIPANRGYPGSLYSDLASRYEKAVEIKGGGSVTIVSVTTMPGDDITHPVPDNTGFITEGQFYMKGGRIDPFGSLSRLKQLVIGKVTREDHGDLANALVRLYADSGKAKERSSMGFRLSAWDEKLVQFATLFENELMHPDVNLPLDDALNVGWKILATCFSRDEVGIKKHLIDTYWLNE
ncbi:V-type ATP synthase beta chain [Candidatus Clavichlamydia salmonicola]|uniref:V-type ATP synthase subunit B n=1 Tax=Candidatus Clavichlamydia salmonicola TaxID=469812 RepID=UPI001891B0B5|nr:V-type ATP synthase subunit B [Candidatus Clavichlamydia salmonicola]MBF5051112.1 V-type ATP synthase beta chain [Candidatus Clavichlamydia salmonicola]